jgi:fructose-1,6-bisphosphatase/inositol monophosphatase family enzyme
MTKPTVPEDFVRVLAPALRQAASLARGLEGRVANRPKPGEGSAVKAALTVADTAAQEVLLDALWERFPRVALEAEEDTASARRFATQGAARVVVDPIDGTLRFYLEGLGPYAVMVGLALDDVYAAALVARPRDELFLDAVRGAGARVAQGDAEPRTVRAQPEGRRVLISHDLPGRAVELLLSRGFAVAPASGGAISVAPLIPGVRAGIRWVPGGSVSVRGRIGALIAEEAGALVRGERGQPFPPNISTPERALLVAADEKDLAALCAAVDAARDDS